MQVNNHLFGTVEVFQEKVIAFPTGLVGFEGSRRLVLIHQSESGE